MSFSTHVLALHRVNEYLGSMTKDRDTNTLPTEFFLHPTELVARQLIGCTLARVLNHQLFAGRIVETEAYLGIQDPACHTFGGRRTPRVTSMYLPGGHAYVYFVYGMHWCFNVVTGTRAQPEAVLIRALEPVSDFSIDGLQVQPNTDSRSMSGPGKLCKVLGIDRALDGHDLSKLPLRVLPRPDKSHLEIESAERVGVAYAGDAAFWPLRYLLAGSQSVSTGKKSRQK